MIFTKDDFDNIHFCEADFFPIKHIICIYFIYQLKPIWYKLKWNEMLKLKFKK